MNPALRRRLVAQALVTLSTSRAQGGAELSDEDADGAATLYNGLLQQLEEGEAKLEGVEPNPADLRTAVTASLQNMLQVAVLSRLLVVTTSKVGEHEKKIAAQTALLEGAVKQNEELLGLVSQLQGQLQTTLALVNKAATDAATLTDDDTRH